MLKNKPSQQIGMVFHLVGMLEYYSKRFQNRLADFLGVSERARPLGQDADHEWGRNSLALKHARMVPRFEKMGYASYPFC